MKDLRLHDLRRTAGSRMAQDGVDLTHIKDALRHREISTTLVYARLQKDSTKDVFEKYGRRLMEDSGKIGPREIAS